MVPHLRRLVAPRVRSPYVWSPLHEGTGSAPGHLPSRTTDQSRAAMGIEAELKFKIPDRPVALGLTVGQTVPLAATGSEGSGRRLDVYDHIHAEFIFRMAPIAPA